MDLYTSKTQAEATATLSTTWRSQLLQSRTNVSSEGTGCPADLDSPFSSSQAWSKTAWKVPALETCRSACSFPVALT